MTKENLKDKHICEEDKEEEEEYILLELDDCLYSDIQPNAPYILSILDPPLMPPTVHRLVHFTTLGLDTLTPTLVVGDGLKMIGEYEETVGTCYLFSESDAPPKPICDEAALAQGNKDKQASISKDGMKEVPPKEVKHLASVQKILKFRSINEDYQQHRA
ncbi:uncharacterized protein LOC100827200 isoform X2 [Brachypodium distachyon]|uniref:Transcription factor TFIIIC triple barrel domain-containing protein n=1 Tax=Brachypodium distachyon TaxID=15368 RepID=A0A0Q3NX11_BRADI|nr:uncharacterized protein LOC100827200 isoform X2 [Brachypodium distachyon]KQK22125.1 hypothetical protein BRADI_1g65377v3 [Brachypodium distachyon]KQK22126.1 hypothetical protein BRADI_1g65377v3 [Brachypodium distachyon]PNT77579.1 hypothetical protein BRADI_1g65377v3 [Brachypodium distachyon]PNT77581.1 hypothetical protein BRADI_1g65377v3 [Brachypodium distachyon]|eukprot:XP_014753278.1 uncharacterized protein LOC100827200 isoform X2 [Brachypodium distachyon]